MLPAPFPDLTSVLLRRYSDVIAYLKRGNSVASPFYDNWTRTTPTSALIVLSTSIPNFAFTFVLA
jgi:hypothetical protein